MASALPPPAPTGSGRNGGRDWRSCMRARRARGRRQLLLSGAARWHGEGAIKRRRRPSVPTVCLPVGAPRSVRAFRGASSPDGVRVVPPGTVSVAPGSWRVTWPEAREAELSVNENTASKGFEDGGRSGATPVADGARRAVVV